MRISRKPAAHTQRKSCLCSANPDSLSRSQRDIVDFGIRAPRSAPCCGNFEFARQIVELRISGECARDSLRDRRRVEDLIGRNSREWTSGHVAHHVSACAFGAESHGCECIHGFDQSFNCQPVQLNVLSDRDVSQIASMFLRDRCNRTQLMRVQNAVRQTDAHHEILGRESLAAFASDSACSIALRVNPPPFEVRVGPLRRNAAAPIASKLPDLFDVIPGVEFTLQALDLLRLGFFHDLCRFCHRDP